ncbi:SusC/RagA family TonB-linked outer membrane protein [Gelidibacter salicanalis]|uniref:SusC/RagA family TonB-linked outer membrane protein n=1 Tax=Gelidibacter salicanalis TaxID=291193 RepID=A0A934NJU7_9FLAO|nr:SusC/RagA family TonB-linked outer membrane protein [Gelidibacter salicanalis]MBJ7881954.1 SusC/RagA family TonB-linked outer membrane protein [Gelidibacter salicanalis]
MITKLIFKLGGITKLMVLLALVFTTNNLFSQDINVTGQVKNEEGLPLSGVNVYVKNSQTGTLSDFDGNYQLTVPSSATLVFSYVGYNPQEVGVNAANPVINVVLQESLEGLDEVVLIGYGQSTKKENTGAVTSIKSDEFNQGLYSDPVGLIQGKVAGLSITQPNGADPLSGYQILLRGANTLTSGQQPLIIIDGVIGADLKNINFQDVESFDVLKDGSAAAIYGTRGTNGVIIITTKQAINGKGTFEYSSQVSVQVSPKGVQNLTADEFVDAINTYQPSRTGSLYGSKTNWFDEVTRSIPISSQNTVSFSGGDEVFSHRSSVTLNQSEGLLQRNESKRLLIKTNIIQSFFDDAIKLNFNLTRGSRTYSPANYDIFRQAFFQNPTQPVYDDTNPDTGGYSFVSGLEYYNPVALLKERTRDGKTNDILANLRVTTKLTDYLTWDNFISEQTSEWEDNSYRTNFYPTALGAGGEAEIANGRSSDVQFESVLDFHQKFGNHNVGVIGGYSFQESKFNSSFLSNTGFDSDTFLYNNIGAGLGLPEGNASLGSYKSKSTLIAFFGRATYNYKEKYLLSASIRKEGSSKFGDNNKWGVFPAISVGWRINEEQFLNDVKWVNNIKLRIGYGVTGNQDFAPYQSLILLNRVGSLFYNQQWINSYGPGQNPNLDLRWEKKKEYNVGLDFSLFDQRFSGSLEYYKRKTEDLLWNFEVPVPPYLFNELFTNVGTISNTGVEATLNGLIINNSDFKWSTTITASHNKNALDKISNAEFTQTSYERGFVGGAVTVFTQRIEEGQELGSFYGPVWLGVSEDGVDVFKNQNPLGVVDKSDWEKIGNANPDAIIGWSNNLSYKNWNLSFAMRAGIGGDVLNAYRLYYESWNGIGLRNVVHTQYENPEFTGNITYSSKYIEDASFLKLDNITLSHDFKINSKYISGLSVFGSAQNVFTITKYNGIDPEVNLGGIEPGIDALSYYPRTTSIAFGLNVKF